MFDAGVEVEVLRAPAVQTSHGTRRGPAVTVFTEEGWAFGPPTPVDSSEPDLSARDMDVERLDGYREGLTTDIAASDQVKLPGHPLPYEVMGRPGVWRDPWTGYLFGSTMRLRRVNG